MLGGNRPNVKEKTTEDAISIDLEFSRAKMEKKYALQISQ